VTFDVSERYFEPEDSAAPDDGAALLDALAVFVRRYVVLRAEQGDAVALWIVHSHASDAAEATPYLSIRSAEKRSGKSLLLEVLGLLAARPLTTANISDAALFRAITAQHPTLLFDEVDAIFGPKARDREDLRGLLNAGYRRGGLVHRMGGAQKTTLEAFEVFCPKALAGIGRLPDTVADRSIALVLKRKSPRESVERFRRREVEQLAEPLDARVQAWADANLDALRRARPDIPDALNDRAADVWEPLLAIADHAGGGWPERARRAALSLSAGDEREDYSLGVRLLADCRQVFDERDCDRLATAELLDSLVADDEAPWAEWRGGTITARALARLLRPYGISSRSVRLGSGETPKGYLREQFEEAWDRYLGPERAPIRHSATTPTVKGIEPISDPPQDRVVADTGTGANPHGQPVVADVADRKPGEKRNGASVTPLPGDSGFRRFLNAACNTGHVTEQERFERRLLHDLVWRARATK
jgi:hypothetical protein